MDVDQRDQGQYRGLQLYLLKELGQHCIHARGIAAFQHVSFHLGSPADHRIAPLCSVTELVSTGELVCAGELVSAGDLFSAGACIAEHFASGRQRKQRVELVVGFFYPAQKGRAGTGIANIKVARLGQGELKLGCCQDVFRQIPSWPLCRAGKALLACRMALPCKRQATPQRARQHSQNVQVIVSRLLTQWGPVQQMSGTGTLTKANLQRHRTECLLRRVMAYL